MEIKKLAIGIGIVYAVLLTACLFLYLGKDRTPPVISFGDSTAVYEDGMDESLLLLDTPGILWPKFEDPEVGLRLAYTGAVKDDILDIESLAMHLMEMLWARYPQALKDWYKLEELPPDTPGYALLEAAGRKRGFLLARGEIDTERMARVLLEEYRSCKLGRFTLELPEGLE